MSRPVETGGKYDFYGVCFTVAMPDPFDVCIIPVEVYAGRHCRINSCTVYYSRYLWRYILLIKLEKFSLLITWIQNNLTWRLCMCVWWEGFIRLKRNVNVVSRPRQRSIDRHLLKRPALMFLCRLQYSHSLASKTNVSWTALLPVASRVSVLVLSSFYRRLVEWFVTGVMRIASLKLSAARSFIKNIYRCVLQHLSYLKHEVL
jgi:hypothetical protein